VTYGTAAESFAPRTRRQRRRRLHKGRDRASGGLYFAPVLDVRVGTRESVSISITERSAALPGPACRRPGLGMTRRW